MVHFWIRHEVKPFEGRVIALPQFARELIAAGHVVTVERSPVRCVPDAEYEAVGCTLVDANAWRTDAPSDAVIMGLKELPEDGQSDAFPLVHRHIYFAHCFKGQDNWEHVMRRFIRGGGTLYDIEFMTNANGRRVAGFSRIAGFVGMALASMAVAHQSLHPGERMPKVDRFESFDALVAHCKSQLAQAGLAPRVLVMGALGRSGGGAVDCARRIGIAEESIAQWDLAETKSGGPFREICEYDILVNCILLLGSVPPFVTREMLELPGRRLAVLSDVSCDPNSPGNPVPIYDRITTFAEPTRRVLEPHGSDPPLDVVAIDHMPSLVPRAASEEVGADLIPFIRAFGQDPEPLPWTNTLAKFEAIKATVPPE